MKIIYEKDKSKYKLFSDIDKGELFVDPKTNNLHLRTNNDCFGSNNTFNFTENKPETYFSYTQIIPVDGELYIKENSL